MIYLHILNRGPKAVLSPLDSMKQYYQHRNNTGKT